MNGILQETSRKIFNIQKKIQNAVTNWSKKEPSWNSANYKQNKDTWNGLRKLDCRGELWGIESPTETLLVSTSFFSPKLMFMRCSSAFCWSPGEEKRQDHHTSMSGAPSAAKAWRRRDLTAVLDTSITCLMTARSTARGLKSHIYLCNNSTAYCERAEILLGSRSSQQRITIKCCPLDTFHIPSAMYI